MYCSVLQGVADVMQCTLTVPESGELTMRDLYMRHIVLQCVAGVLQCVAGALQ